MLYEIGPAITNRSPFPWRELPFECPQRAVYPCGVAGERGAGCTQGVHGGVYGVIYSVYRRMLPFTAVYCRLHRFCTVSAPFAPLPAATQGTNTANTTFTLYAFTFYACYAVSVFYVYVIYVYVTLLNGQNR